MKTCRKCKRGLLADQFWKDNSTKDGLQVWCKSCRYEWVKDNQERRKVTKRKNYVKYQGRHVADQRARREADPEASRAVCRNWYAKNKDKGRALNRKFQLRRRYGLTLADYDVMLKAQGGVCAICRGNRSNKRLAVDHDHNTLAIRGLLCVKCNAGLGGFGDDPGLLLAALAYLARYAKAVA